LEVTALGAWATVLSWLGVGCLWLWAGAELPAALIFAALAVGFTVVVERPARSRRRAAGLMLVVLGIVVGFMAERQVGRAEDDWDAYWTQRVDEIGVLLSDELDRRQLQGEAAARALLERWTREGADFDGAVVAEVRARYGSSALALYDSAGSLVAWDGTHRGKVPESVQRGDQRQAYRDLPLFGYLYLSARGPDGTVAVAAYLLRAALPEGLGADMQDFATQFQRESGERIRITEQDPGLADAVWDLALDDDRLLSVVLERPERDARVAAIRRRWAIAVSVIASLAWLVLALGGPLTRLESMGGALTALMAAAFVPLPVGPTTRPLLDPLLFSLPGPGVTAGRLLVWVMALFILVGVVPRARRRVPAWVAGAIAGLAFPLVLLWIRAGAAPGLLAEGRVEWIGYQMASSGLLALVGGVCIAHGRTGERARAWTGAGIAMSTGLSAGLGVIVAVSGAASVWWATLWAIPVALVALGLHGWRGWQRSVVAWASALVLGSSLAIPVVWGDGIEARLAEGERRLARLTAVEDPDLEDRLVEYARLADSLDASGAEDVSILYQGWRLSGLAELGHPVWLQIELRDGSPGEGLRVGVSDSEPEPYQDMLTQGRAFGGVRLVQLNQDDARYILTAPLANDRMLVAVAPPFPETSGRSALGPLLRGTRDPHLEALTVMALPESGAGRVGEAMVRSRSNAGWRLDLGLRFSNGPAYRARYAVDLPSVPLGVARATLMVVLNVMVFLTFWVIGRTLIGDTGRERVQVSALVISFRARVTLALFGFFALANALFGTVAYRTLAQASHRSAQVIAERVVEDAAEWYQALFGQMERIASQVGAELLEYRDGELLEGSRGELVELGLYEGWTPYDVRQRLDGFQDTQEFTETSIGRWEYVTAYRRLTDGDVLAAQVALEEGTSALQTTDLIELLGFVILVGAALSLALAMVAGRALTRPILALQIASESVGSGDLSLRLPAHRNDEFGAVFRAFNRMVGRVRRARRQLVRTSRRTQLIMNEAAVGMVALDPTGKVTLVNPRAEELLGAQVSVGERLPDAGDLGEALGSWLGEFLDGNADETNSDFQVGDRRVRVRARRLGSFGTRRGVVVALDDVTDELKAERVLAWGEMARQVAHEVKNPLTPIKLSIQHVRRAWDDRRPDFDEILVRNADAMLKEIDRLAEIAQSFSRFGAPGGQDVPLTAVSLEDVVAEVLVLYGGSAAKVHFEQEIEPGLPAVVARTAELKEVLVNLLENARLAGQDGTRVVIRARRTPDPESLTLEVEDDGAGIPEDVLPRIFEPQFSTRSKGAGLGLAIVQRVVRAWGGSVAVESEVGQGTRVSVTLRVWAEKPRAAE
jgi:signal transduction histidine kinase